MLHLKRLTDIFLQPQNKAKFPTNKTQLKKIFFMGDILMQSTFGILEEQFIRH
jgi:hypothetical protein